MDLIYVHDENREYFIDMDKVCSARRINADSHPGMTLYLEGGLAIHISSNEEVARIWSLLKKIADQQEYNRQK